MSKPKSFALAVGAGIPAAVLVAAVALAAPPASAGPLTEGTVLPNYAIVSVGPNSSIKVNSGPITGNVLLGDGNVSSSSGGNNGRVTGEVDVSPSTTGDHLANIQNPPNIVNVPSSVGTTAFSDAAILASNAESLAATQTFTNITNPTTITGNGGLNVIDVVGISSALTLSGTANDTFVFRVSGVYNTNDVMKLIGVAASDILFDFTKTSGNVFQTAGGDVSFGTYLATHGGDFQFSNLNLTGQLINTGGHIEFVSGSMMSDGPFIPVPAPLIGHGLYVLLAVGSVWWRNTRRVGGSSRRP
jgi:hypothetical protein